MGKEIKQFRYYGDSNPGNLNYPTSLKKDDLRDGRAFLNSDLPYSSIASLGIQTLPGVQFYLNGSVDPIIVGSTGIYELNLTDDYSINELRFEKKSLDLIGSYSGDAYLIVDVIYNMEV